MHYHPETIVLFALVCCEHVKQGECGQGIIMAKHKRVDDGCNRPQGKCNRDAASFNAQIHMSQITLAFFQQRNKVCVLAAALTESTNPVFRLRAQEKGCYWCRHDISILKRLPRDQETVKLAIGNTLCPPRGLTLSNETCQPISRGRQYLEPHSQNTDLCADSPLCTAEMINQP